MSEHTEQEDLEVLAKSDLLVPDSLTMRELADHFMELWGEHLAATLAMDGVSDDEVAAATRQMGRVVDRLVNQETAVAGTVFTRTDVELMADWSAMDDIASLSTIGGLASVVNDYPAFDFSEAAAGEAPAADGRLRVFTVYHGNMRQDCTGGHVSWYFEDDGTMPEPYLSRERAEEKFREWSGDLQGEFDREAACRGGRPTVMMARTGYGVELRQEVWERDEDGEWTIATDDLGLMESETLDTASYTLDDHLAAIERQEREQEQGYDLASACRESCLAADALAEDEKNDLDGRDDR